MRLVFFASWLLLHAAVEVDIYVRLRRADLASLTAASRAFLSRESEDKVAHSTMSPLQYESV